jgi:DNA-binding response OmpR family regulator
MAVILLIEDNPDIMNINASALKLRGYDVLCAEAIEPGREILARRDVDCVVLDILLPDGNGIDLCMELKQTYDIPILFLSALDKNEDIVDGLRAGGDDYLSKPYDLEVLIARIEALLRRADRVAEKLSRGTLTLDIVSGTAYLEGDDLLLPQKEFALLLLFVQNEGRTMSAETLYDKVWKASLNNDPGAIKYQISRLRKKLAGCGYTIVTEYGEGYRFIKEN